MPTNLSTAPYFAALTLPELAPILTIFVGMLVGFYGLLKYLLDTNQKTAEADRTERQLLAKAVEKMADSNLEIAKETKKGNQEAKQRNGHLGEQNIQISDQVAKQSSIMAELFKNQNQDVADIKNSTALTASVLSKSAIIAAEDREILTGGNQVVHEQVVEHQTVKGKE